MNKPTATQFFLVLIIITTLYFILNFLGSYLYIDKLIKTQIIFLIIIAAGNYIWQKLGVQSCNSLQQTIILVVALFVMTDILLYLLHINAILAIILSLIIYLIIKDFLRKQGYLKTKCEINNTNNKHTDIPSDIVNSTSALHRTSILNYLISRTLPYVVLLQVIFSIPLFIYLCGSFIFLLYVRLVSAFILFVFFLGINILNFVGILCFKKQRTDLYFYCVIGMLLFIIFLYFEFQNNFT